MYDMTYLKVTSSRNTGDLGTASGPLAESSTVHNSCVVDLYIYIHSLHTFQRAQTCHWTKSCLAKCIWKQKHTCYLSVFVYSTLYLLWLFLKHFMIVLYGTVCNVHRYTRTVHIAISFDISYYTDTHTKF